MARRKRQSQIIQKGTARSAALVSIDPALDLGKGLTLPIYRGKVQAAQEKLDAYNTLLSSVDGARATLDAAENEVADLTERMLKGVASLYGRNSDEYEKAGGTRKSHVRRPQRTTSNVTKLAA